MTRESGMQERRVSHTASRRCNKNAIILFFVGFSILWWISRKKSGGKRNAVRWWIGWMRESVWRGGRRAAKIKYFKRKLRGERQKKTHQQCRYARCQDIARWYNFGCTMVFVLIFFFFLLFLLLFCFVHFAFNFSEPFVLFFDRFGLISDCYKSQAVGNITARCVHGVAYFAALILQWWMSKIFRMHV